MSRESGFPPKRKGRERRADSGKKERKSTETQSERKTPRRTFSQSETVSQTTSDDNILERTPTKGKEAPNRGDSAMSLEGRGSSRYGPAWKAG
ncbi:hypothetical protein NDU88_005073 [Pleurodeles waltl]|uniref:Uncharacterized protein n=1 Tax=Pleurodeles waltl TaxID=8319 RepID=A0AAV7M8Y0_PLEWA|nr:hypothetical protein NDU88_005073 [Pleurodeles waltl]